MAGSLSILLLAAAALLGGASSASASDTFRCSLTPLNQIGWIPEQVSVHFLEGRASAVIHTSEEGSTVHAVLKQRSKETYMMDWTPSPALAAKATELSSERYRAILNLGNLKVSLQILSDIFPGAWSPRGAGTCVRLDSTLP